MSDDADLPAPSPAQLAEPGVPADTAAERRVDASRPDAADPSTADSPVEDAAVTAAAVNGAAPGSDGKLAPALHPVRQWQPRRRRRAASEIPASEIPGAETAPKRTGGPRHAAPSTEDPELEHDPDLAAADVAAVDVVADGPWGDLDDADPDADGEPVRRGRRALRWLLEQAPSGEPAARPRPRWGAGPGAAGDPSAAPGTVAPETVAPGTVAPETVGAPPAVDPAASPAPVAAAGSGAPPAPRPRPQPADPAGAERDLPSTEREHDEASLLGRIKRWRGRRDPEDDDLPPLVLPEPDVAFETSWLRVGTPPPIDRSGSVAAAAQPAAVAGIAGAADAPRPKPVAPPPGVSRPLPAAGAPGGPGGPVELRKAPAPLPQLGISGISMAGAAVDASPADAVSVPAGHPRPSTPVTISGAASPPTVPAPPRIAGTSEPDPEPARAADEQPHAKRRWFADRRRLLRMGIRLAIVVVFAGAAVVLLRAYVVAPYYIPSASMEPTLQGGGGRADDHVLVDKLSYRAHDPRQGDIIVFHRPATWPASQVPEKTLIKRIVGMPGDRISMRKGVVYLNGVPYDETYLNKDKSCYANTRSPEYRYENFGTRVVPEGDYYVMGDNRCDSLDSRAFGPVSRSTIIGRAFATIWPVSRIRGLS